MPRRPRGRSAATLGLSMLVAFFPKCPLCWAAWSSSLGLAGILQGPHVELLFPVLIGLLGVHLWLMLKQAAQAGYGPLLLSTAGISTLLLGRRFLPEVHWLLGGGILLMLAGSVWNSLAMRRGPAEPHASTATPQPAPDPS